MSVTSPRPLMPNRSLIVQPVEKVTEFLGEPLRTQRLRRYKELLLLNRS